MRSEFDVIIVGASFAGLATASRLSGDVLLLDPHPIGSHERSACGTFLSVPTTLDLLNTVVDVSARAMVHTSSMPSYELDDPLCTLDYRRFCEGLFAQGSATFVQSAAKGYSMRVGEHEVETAQGSFRAPIVVDASGWRAVLASKVDESFVDRSSLNYGLETKVSFDADSYYFWLDKETQKDGVGWVFPSGSGSRIGLASYRGETIKAGAIRQFLGPTGAEHTKFHGGYFPNRLRRGSVGGFFVTGDSAGQCLPLTGEGIRPAIFFGQRCGDLIQQVLDSEMALDSALARYDKLVNGFRWRYRGLRLEQTLFPGLPEPIRRPLFRSFSIPSVVRPLIRKYVGMMPLLPPIDRATSAQPSPVGAASMRRTA